jgi:aspartyl-tRNA(Asn)/glutamyl-tRNA(Gln) amidotransferase subunit B
LIGSKGQEPVLSGVAKLAANWITGDISARLNADNKEITEAPVNPENFARLLARILDQTLSNKIAKEVFSAMWAGEGTADEIIAKRGLKQISDSGELEKIADQVIAANAQQVADYRSGKEKAFNSLVGQVMKATRGKANPQQVNDILKRKLAV